MSLQPPTHSAFMFFCLWLLPLSNARCERNRPPAPVSKTEWSYWKLSRIGWMWLEGTPCTLIRTRLRLGFHAVAVSFFLVTHGDLHSSRSLIFHCVHFKTQPATAPLLFSQGLLPAWRWWGVHSCHWLWKSQCSRSLRKVVGFLFVFVRVSLLY